MTYAFAGVRSFGGGCFPAGDRSGTETRYPKLLQLEEDDLIFPKLMAWEGAFAVVPEALAGTFVSPEFCTFRTDPKRLDIRFLANYFRWPDAWARVAGSSPGTNVRRRRLYPEPFLNQTIPLPPIDEQRAIATHLDRALRMASELVSAGARSTEVVNSAMASIRHAVLVNLAEESPAADLEAVALVSMGTSPSGESYNDSGVGMPLLNGPTEFGGAHPEARQWTTSPTTVSKEGDLLMSVRASIGRMNWADREYCIGRGLASIRPIGDVDVRYLRHVLIFRASEIMAMTAGTTFLNLPGAKLKKLPVPLMPGADLKRIADTLDEAEEKVRSVQALRARTTNTLKALPASILNAAFEGRN